MVKRDSDERIEKAKRKYKVAEDATDSFLTKLVMAPYTFAVLVVLLLCIVGAWWQLG